MDSRSPIIIDDSEDEESSTTKNRSGRLAETSKVRELPSSDRRGATITTPARTSFPVRGPQPKSNGTYPTQSSSQQRNGTTTMNKIVGKPPQPGSVGVAASRTITSPGRTVRVTQSAVQTASQYTHTTTAKPPIAQTPQTLTRHDVCQSCQELGVGCDGEWPCSTCAEPGIPCDYPGRKKPPRPQPQPVKAASTLSNRQSTLNNTSSSSLQNNQKPSEVLQSASSPSTPRPGDVVSTMKQAQQQQIKTVTIRSPTAPHMMTLLNVHHPGKEKLASEESLALTAYDSVSSDIESVRTLMQRLQTEMKQYRETFIKPILKQAKADSITTSIQSLSSKSTDPFANLKPKVQVAIADTKAASKTMDTATFQYKTHYKGVSSKWKIITTTVDRFPGRDITLPKYRSIGRLGPSTLAPNVRTSKYWVYDATDEIEDATTTDKYKELEQRYNHDYTSMNLQRKCFEVVELWRPWVEHAVKILKIDFNDILHFYLHHAPLSSLTSFRSQKAEEVPLSWVNEKWEACKTCELDPGGPKWNKILYLLPVPETRTLTLAGIFAFVFHDTCGVSLWHIASTSPSIKKHLDRAYPGLNDTEGADSLCLVCFLHNCPTHGEYQESDDDNPGQESEAYINDDEKEHNGRQHVSLAYIRENEEIEHVCGLYCVDRSYLISELYGRRPDRTVAGHFREDIVQTTNKIHDSHSCSAECFWLVSNRRKAKVSELSQSNVPLIPPEWTDILRAMIPSYLSNKRGPCMLSALIPGVSCLTIFYHMLMFIGRRSHPPPPQVEALVNGVITTQGRKVSKIQLGLDTTKSAELDERPPFVPCSHDGPCQNNTACNCAEDKIFCEWFCGCDMSCKRRFRGCTCSMISRTCFNDARCECWVNNRECDPWLCKGCGVVEVLDSSNKYNEAIRKGRCQNNRIQLNLPARTIKAPSEVQGYGLFAGEDLEEFAYIGEYRGEIVSTQESDRRGAVYANLGQEYLFVINRDQEMDASKMGNKMRFMNNSQLDSNINVVAKKMLCNGVQRVMLYAKRKIMAGEELLYNYNYPISVVKKFWERGEKPPDASGGTVMPADNQSPGHVRGSGRFAKISNDVHDGVSANGKMSMTAKRKRDGEDVRMTDRAGDSESDHDHEFRGFVVADDDEEDDNFDPRRERPTLRHRKNTNSRPRNISDEDDDTPLAEALRKRQVVTKHRQAVRKVSN